jgi:ribonuclease BN (tRNA processing enzyme)
LTQLTFIGTSDAFGAGGRRQACIHLRTPSGSLLLDCGPTTLTGLAAVGIPRDDVDAIVISHFHADHFGGIPLFILGAIYEDQRRKPIRIVGPPGVRERVGAAAAALGHALNEERTPFAIHFDEYGTEAETAVAGAALRAFEAYHSPDSLPHGFVVTAGGKRIAYTGDTGWFDAFPDRVRGADLLVTECTYVEKSFAYHLSLEELEARRAELECGRIVLTHLGPAMSDLRGEASFETAEDGMILNL